MAQAQIPDPAPGTDPRQRDIDLQKAAYITQAARAATAANVLAPSLCVPLFWNDADPLKLQIWMAYMALAVIVRTTTTARLPSQVADITDPARNLRTVTLGVGLIGLGWGLGWALLTPDLTPENRMIYLYITTGAMFLSIFGYGVHWPAFFAFSLPAIVPAISTVLWPSHVFPWPFAQGIATLFLGALRIAKNFSRTYAESVALRFRNESLYQALSAERDTSIAANVAKSRFIAEASHDLRQPMHAVNVYLESLHWDRLEAHEKSILEKIKGSMPTVNQMFNALLSVSKLDAFNVQVMERHFALAELVEPLREVYQPQAERKGLVMEIEHPWAHVTGDLLVLQQVLGNLISNAIQYTEAGRVDVVFSAKDAMLEVQVRDTGRGISAEERELVFKEFYRSKDSRLQHDGLGLGLSIVQRLCALIGARIDLQSTPGQGTCFTLLTNCPVGEARAARPAPASPAAAGHAPLRGHTLALIENDPTILEAYRQTFARHGAQVLVLPLALDQCDRFLEEVDHIDCIVSDYRLGELTGDVFIEHLRQSFNQDIPALIVTADTSPEHVRFFKGLDVPVLHKPVSFEELVRNIERLLERSPEPG